MCVAALLAFGVREARGDRVLQRAAPLRRRPIGRDAVELRDGVGQEAVENGLVVAAQRGALEQVGFLALGVELDDLVVPTPERETGVVPQAAYLVTRLVAHTGAE